MIMNLWRVLSITFFFCLGAEALAQTPRQVINDFLSATGSKQRWDEVTSVKQTAVLWQNFDYFNVPAGVADIIAGIEPSNELRIEKLPKSLFTRNVNSKKETIELFQNENGTGVVLLGQYIDKPTVSEPVEITIVQVLQRAYKSDVLKALGTRKIDGVDYNILNGPSGETTEHILDFYFNATTKLLDFTQEFLSEGAIRTVFYKDYRPVDNLLTPFTIESRYNGILFYRENKLSVEFNPKIDDSVFVYSPPNKRPRSAALQWLTKTDMPFGSFVAINFKDRRVLVDFWATWCKPCVEEFEHYDREYYNLLKAHNISPLFISIDKESEDEKWKEKAKELGLEGCHVRADSTLRISVMRRFFRSGNVVMPRYVLIDEHGRVTSDKFIRRSNPRFKDELSRAFKD
jgi:thiol-disulfide isomerase/thioredoxin